jgi:SEFIR domain
MTKVFISYSHDTVEHQERVLAFADRLRADGIDAEIDQHNASPPEGWPLWCARQIKAADFVLMICTETYCSRVNGDEKPGRGLGVVWEALFIRLFLYDLGGVTKKFIPVLFSDASPEHIPTLIRGRAWYVVDTQDGYKKLYGCLTGQKREPEPPLPPRGSVWSKGKREAATSAPYPGLRAFKMQESEFFFGR